MVKGKERVHRDLYFSEIWVDPPTIFTENVLIPT